MKRFSPIFAGLVLMLIFCGLSPRPAWQPVEGKSLKFFKSKGFEFSVDDSMAHHYEKPTVEISIMIPEGFMDAGRTNRFDFVLFRSADISAALAVHPREGKKRIILTVSEAVTKTAQIVFYFRNDRKETTHGSMYLLNLDPIFKEWKLKKRVPSKNGTDVRGLAEPNHPSNR